MEASPVLMAAPPPPRAGEEGTAEMSSSPPCRREFHEVLARIEERLRRTAGRHDQMAATLADDPASFRRRLAHHLERLPASYLADIDAGDRAEDVLLHCRILDEAADPDKRPVFHARYLKSITLGANYSCSDEELDKPCQRSMQGLSLETKAVDAGESWALHLHEIIFCALDKRKLLCEEGSAPLIWGQQSGCGGYGGQRSLHTRYLDADAKTCEGNGKREVGYSGVIEVAEHMKVFPVCNSIASGSPRTSCWQNHPAKPSQELSTLFDGFGLHIREGHLYCTVDGLCMAIFVVQGWKTEEIDELIDGIRKTSKEACPLKAPTYSGV